MTHDNKRMSYLIVIGWFVGWLSLCRIVLGPAR